MRGGPRSSGRRGLCMGVSMDLFSLSNSPTWPTKDMLWKCNCETKISLSISNVYSVLTNESS